MATEVFSLRDEVKKEYYDLQRFRYNKCLEPMGRCAFKAINAHSIQNAKVFDLLAENGHIVKFCIKHISDAPRIELEQLGRNKACTFQGLCSEHDQELFRPIDSQDIDLSNPEHLFLIAYRSVLRELHAKTQSARKLYLGLEARIRRGDIPRDVPTPASLIVSQWASDAYDAYVYKRKFDALYLERKFKCVAHKVIRYSEIPPTLAVSTLYTLDDMEWPDDVARIALNVFPDGQGTNVVFSCIANERAYVSQYLDRLLNAAGDYQRYLISKVVLQNCENFVISPMYYDEWADEKRLAIEKFYTHTLLRNDHGYEDEHLYLF